MTGLLADRKRMLSASQNFDLSSQSTSSETLYMALSDDLDVAYHEAGHSVASVIFGISFQDVSASACHVAGSDGRITYRTTLRELLHPQVGAQGGIGLALKACICLMAGPAAEFRYRGDEADLSSTARMDRRQLCDMSDLISQEMFVTAARLEKRGLIFDKNLPLKIQQWAWREACLMIGKPRIWRSIESLARLLEENEIATESEVSGIVASESVRYRPNRFHVPNFAPLVERF